MASGQQWMSWIHADDLVSMVLFALSTPHVRGPVNATAPHPVRNQEFSKALGEAVGSPAVLTTPAFALRLMLGEAAQVVLASQRVIPASLRDAGFTWAYEDVRSALKAAV